MRGIIKGVALALVLSSGVSGPLAAQSDSTPSTGIFKVGQDIYDLCVSDDVSEVETCDWFIMSAHDTIKFYGDTNTGGALICLPIGTTALEVREVVLDYWRADTAALRYSAVSTIYNALVERYGCDG